MLIPLVFCAIFLFATLNLGAACAETCERWVGKVVSVQGGVQALKEGERQWRPVKLNDFFCPGDRVQILKLGRADILLSNESVLRLDQNTTVTFPEPEKEKSKSLWVNLLRGAACFFSRIPRTLRVFTPFVNAIVEGTEFYARVEDDNAFLSIFDGRVVAANQAGSITLASGQSAVAQADRAPVFQVVVRPRDVIRWTLYYPPILYLRPADFPSGPLRKSIDAYGEGNLEKALEAVTEMTEEIQDPHFLIYRASLLLSVGRGDEARSDIEKALRLTPTNSHAIALQSVIAVVQNEKDKALVLARKAVETGPHSASARIALSYALQANFNLKGALDSLKDAVKLEPENALAWARLAELWLSLGELNRAFEDAEKAATLSPNLSRTQTVLGFAYLTQIKTKLAIQAFQKAIEFDQADPLPRLGLGLARIREGDLADGRGEIEIAASLDPDSSLIRSYLGKAYYEEKRDRLASNQFATAKELDPSDPTPFFYDAIRKQSTNQPVEALRDLQQSIALNDNRAIYRSRLLLDSDLAARSASLGRIYSDLGFQQLALVEGWKSVNIDPANYSAHRFLADSYTVLPRHEIARVSELLQSQLLQPININPVQPHLAESKLFILNGAGLGPADLSFNEFNPLFERNRFALQASGIWGEDSTWGEEVVHSGVQGRLSYSLGQFHFETEGFRKNNDLKEDIYDVFGQFSLSHHTSVLAEFRSTDNKRGDLGLRFFPNDFLPNLRQEDKEKALRFGFRHAFAPGSDLIGHFTYQQAESKLHNKPIPILEVDFDSDADSIGGELQYLFRSERFNMIGGIGHFNIDRKDVSQRFSPLPPSVPPDVAQWDIDHTNLYLYSHINYPKDVTFTIGASADFLEGGIIDRHQFNPKLGLTWTPFSTTTVRAAALRTLKRSLITNQTLEPTQVAGFNQFFDDFDGTESWRYGIAIDQKVARDIHVGAEYSRRNLEVPFIFNLPPAPAEVRKVDWKERLGRAYVYWTPHQWLALSAEYQYEELERDEEFTANTAQRVKTHRLPFGLNVYHPIGLSANLKATYMHQKGEFQPQGAERGVSFPGQDDFWVVDASISYRLPKRLGVITLGVKNLFDRSFRFQDTDPVNPQMRPDRLVFGKFTLAF